MYDIPKYEPVTAEGEAAIIATAARPMLAPLPSQEPLPAEPMVPIGAAPAEMATTPESGEPTMVLQTPVSNAPYPDVPSAPTTSEVATVPVEPGESSMAANDDAFVRDTIPAMSATPPDDAKVDAPLTTTAARPVPNWQQPSESLPTTPMNDPSAPWQQSQLSQQNLPTTQPSGTTWQNRPSVPTSVAPGTSNSAGQHGYYRMDQQPGGTRFQPRPGYQSQPTQSDLYTSPTQPQNGPLQQTPSGGPAANYGPTTRATELQLNPQAARAWPQQQAPVAQHAPAPGSAWSQPARDPVRVARQPGMSMPNHAARRPVGQVVPRYAVPTHALPNYGVPTQAVPNSYAPAQYGPAHGVPYPAGPSSARLVPQIQPLTGTTR